MTKGSAFGTGKKRKTQTAVVVASIAAVAGVLAYLALAGGIPHIIIDEDPIIPDPSEKFATGELTYDITLNFKDGSSKTFSDKVSISEIPLQSITAGGNELDNIVVRATADVDIPENVDEFVTKTMYVESRPALLMNGQQIGGVSTNTFFSFDQLAAETPVQLYEFTVDARDVSLTTGTYALTLESHEQIRFVVNGENRVTDINAEPTFALSSENGLLKELYVVSYSPAVSTSLERITQYGGWQVLVKAEGFKPFSDIRFTYVDRGLRYSNPDHPTGSAYSVLTAKGQVVIQGDAAGNAVDVTEVKGGYSKPDRHQYYAHIIVDDGENYAFGKAGQSWRLDTGRGENPQFYVWPPCVNSTLDGSACIIDWELVEQMIADGGGGHYPA